MISPVSRDNRIQCRGGRWKRNSYRNDLFGGILEEQADWRMDLTCFSLARRMHCAQNLRRVTAPELNKKNGSTKPKPGSETPFATDRYLRFSGLRCHPRAHRLVGNGSARQRTAKCRERHVGTGTVAHPARRGHSRDREHRPHRHG